MPVTSANPEHLAAFVAGSVQRLGRLGTQLETTIAAANSASVNSSYNHPSTPSLAALGELLNAWLTNTEFVQVIHDELVKADTYDGDGVATVANAAIDATLQERGLGVAPDLVDVDEIVMYGQPPYSGWVDDPINLATGNFLLRDGDLPLHGVGAAISVVRTYSSRDRGTGVFGPGWTSIVDARLTLEEGRATYRSLDGGGAVFHRLPDGTWSHDPRRDLTLVATDAGWDVREGHDRVWRFDGDGVLRSFTAGQAEVTLDRRPDAVVVVDRTSGRAVTYRLDATGRVTTVESSDGRTVTYDRDHDGRLAAVHRDRGDVVYEHDELGFLARIRDADGVVICRNEYDERGRVLSQVEHHGRETSYDYRADGVATVTASDGAPPNVMVHDRRGRMTAMFDGLGNAMRLTYDDRDHVVQVVKRSGAVTRLAYDERGNVVERVDPDGVVSTFGWDDAERLVELTDRAGGTTRLEYERDRRVPARIVHPDGSVIAVTYDDLDLITAVSDADGVVTRMAWNRDGLLEMVEGAGGERFAVEHDGTGRVVALEAHDGRYARLHLDRAGRVTTRVTAAGEEHFTYSVAGRMVGGRDAAGTAWQAQLDPAGEIAALADAS
jgi:YD repeat-containing protein